MQLSMGIIKIEVSLPEAMRALEEFRSNRLKAFEELTEEVKGAASKAINQLLQSEMTFFLGKPDQEGNKRNGYESRDYALKGIGCIRLKMPVDRHRNFSSVVVPKGERIDPRLKEDMAVLHLAGLSKRTLAMISKRVLGVEVSSQTVSNSLQLLEPQALAWLDRDLSSKKYWALFIDGTNFRIQRRSSTAKEPSLVVLGIDQDNHMSLLAVEPGTKDNTEAWRAVFSSLIERGFDVSAVRVGIMDGLPGLESLFKEIFPNSVTARCWVHALSNACARSPERLREAFKKLAHRVMYASSENAARVAFNELKDAMGKDAERAVKTIEKDLESLLIHYRFDRPLWRVLKTTNPIERVNREFKRRTKSMDALGEKTLQVLLAFTALRLEYHWMRLPVTKPWLELLPKTKKEIINNQIESTIEALAGQA
jgi:putative transposase